MRVMMAGGPSPGEMARVLSALWFENESRFMHAQID